MVAFEIALISRDKPAVPAIMGQLSTRGRSPRMGATMSGSQTSGERIRPGAVVEGNSPKVAVAGAARSRMTAEYSWRDSNAEPLRAYLQPTCAEASRCGSPEGWRRFKPQTDTASQLGVGTKVSPSSPWPLSECCSRSRFLVAGVSQARELGSEGYTGL